VGQEEFRLSWSHRFYRSRRDDVGGSQRCTISG